MNNETLEALAESLAAMLTRATRDNGETFYKLKDDAPDWIRDAVREAHGTDMLPDDMKYKMIREVAYALANWTADDWDNADDLLHELVDDQVDVYNHDRVRWLASHLNRAGYVDQANEEGLIGDGGGLFEQLGCGQYLEYQEIADALLSAIRKHAEQSRTWRRRWIELNPPCRRSLRN